MKLKIDLDDFEWTGKKEFKIGNAPTRIPDLYEDEEDYDARMTKFRAELDELQTMMYAHNRYGLLVIFQALDAAGKDGTIKHVMSGVNPFGIKIHNFKRPTDDEIDHDFLWRTNLRLPERGTITIFNRSYYEEVLIAKIHPEILTESQRIPAELTDDLDKVWKQRYEDMANLERYLHHNGIVVLKFFLNVSKKEQAERLIERIEDSLKNWKFEEQDVKERDFWDDYQRAYQDAINATATGKAPWYVVPADDKKNMRLIVSNVIIAKLKEFKMNFPPADETRRAKLQTLIETIKKQNGE
ncbi:MAG: polyphosphate kinase 2 family protein [Cytophagaceae bacterium]|nr:polyphosphate kinase 2 family protein [Cytophagaceae bacterium]